jgi:hypothetical protein
MKRSIVLFLASLLPATAYAGRAEFTCGAPVGQVCYITIFFTTGWTKNFELKGGEKDWITDVHKGDKWCSARNTGVPNPNTCKRNDVANIVE